MTNKQAALASNFCDMKIPENGLNEKAPRECENKKTVKPQQWQTVYPIRPACHNHYIRPRALSKYFCITNG
ncbi:hypothetical protein [Roseobacter sp. HKCCA2468]|uniref:hypothetical protein n=1 Tax=Roseobacter sp. HKCCA2468 TaxID=3120342 RepID=UPI0030EB8D16